jgi:hypothetical protein
MQPISREPSKILIYLGPTLSITKASQFLSAHYLNPVRCGDILACLRLQPRVIGIIDGFFDSSAAVWHKEILWAMEAGVKVFGASSMGALRAAELEVFGMEGFGSIFTAYREGKYIGDDEVAILHSNAEFDYKPLSDALVNIRATVDRALSNNIIDSGIADLILSCAKRRFFDQRLIASVVADAKLAGGDPRILSQFWEFVKTGGYVDQKQLDAIGLLKYLAAMEGEIGTTTSHEHKKFKFSKSIFIEDLQARVAIRPLHTSYSWLPLTEKICQASRFMGRVYIQLRNLAGLLRWCDATAQQQKLQPLEDCQIDGTIAKTFNLDINTIAKAIDSDLSTIEPLFKRLGRIQALLKLYCEQDTFIKRVDELYKFILVIVGKDVSFTQANIQTKKLDITTQLVSCELSLYRQVAILWTLAEQSSSQSVDNLRSSIKQKVTQNFLQQQGVTNETEYQAWLSIHSYNQTEFSRMMVAITQLEGFVNVPRWWARGMTNYFSPNEYFLPDALIVSGFYPILRNKVENNGLEESELKNWYQTNSFPPDINIAQVAFWLDFTEPQELLT